MFKRYSVYFVPDGIWGDFGAQWLGWDNRSGSSIEPISPLDLTKRPRKYGFHATIKPPFRLADTAAETARNSGRTVESALSAELDTLCASLEPVTLTSLQLVKIGRFFALAAPGEHDAIAALASEAVRRLDPLRAPPTDAELTRRRQSRLTDRQDALLTRWGYPFVMEEFRFHLTLTGQVKDPKTAEALLREHLSPLLSQPMQLDTLSLLGEDAQGCFHQITRCPIAY